MAQSNNTTATRNNEVVNPSNAPREEAQSRRLWETRDMWAVVFDHTAELLALTLKGEKLPENPRSGFGFGGKVTTKGGKEVKLKVSQDQPHIQGYALSLLKGFGSYATKKAIKALAEIGVQNEVLEPQASRLSTAIAVVEACKWAKAGESVKKLDNYPAKQGKAMLLAVVAKLNEVELDTQAELAELLAD